MRLAVVVQRYGTDVAGGAELHARHVAEHLSRHAEVEVLTSCAVDYVTWRNELRPGRDTVDGLPVLRFPVRRPRDVERFGRASGRVFEHTHSIAEELDWLDAEGPDIPGLVRHVRTHRTAYDYFLFWSFRYHQAYYGARAVPDRAILVPTAEREPAVGVSLFAPLFRGVRGLVYLTPEERALVNGASGNQGVPDIVAGSGSEVPAGADAARFRAKYGIDRRFAVYVGRVDANKGCTELFEFFLRYARSEQQPLQLVLCGNSILPIPSSPHVRHLGFVPDEDKFDAIAAADVLIMPSYFESLSIVTLEAWALGKPVLANGRCDVLKGQCLRSNGGLYYGTEDEFCEALRWFAGHADEARALGMNGRDFYRRHYAWPAVEQQYLGLLERLSRERGTGRRRLEPLPGWFARRRETCDPAARVLGRLPQGPVLE